MDRLYIHMYAGDNVAERGYPGFEALSWSGLSAPRVIATAGIKPE